MQPQRRALVFRDLNEAVHDAEALLVSGYVRAGQWDLSQVCGHLADWLRFPVDGFPRPPLPVRLILSVMRMTVGQKELRRILATNAMRSGGHTIRGTVPPPGGDAAAAVAQFRGAVRRFQAHDGPFHPSPLFGPLDRETATRLQLVHCAHHLSFLVPKVSE